MDTGVSGTETNGFLAYSRRFLRLHATIKRPIGVPVIARTEAKYLTVTSWFFRSDSNKKQSLAQLSLLDQQIQYLKRFSCDTLKVMQVLGNIHF